MLRIVLTEEQIVELKAFRNQASSQDSEKALMILMNHEGQSPVAIGKILKRHAHTVRDWIKRYIDQGIQGLQRNYSPGRPSEIRDKIKEVLNKILGYTPQNYGYLDTVWTTKVINHALSKHFNIETSEDTIERALHDLGYSYKRPSKKPSTNQVNKEEKRAQFNQTLNQIKALSERETCEIYAMDETHFSTEPYLVRGWFLKKNTPSDRNAQKKRRN